jgi:S1-C subfamily serine protease
MAERLAAAHRRDPGRLPVALIGVGHLEGGDGVPQQLRELGLSSQLSLRRPPLPASCTPAPRGARLGAYLESDAGGVWVRRVAPGSAAAAAGLEPGDRILKLNGQPVQRAGQVIRGVRLHPDGRPLQLTIERAGRQRQLELQLPPSSDPRLAARDNGANA